MKNNLKKFDNLIKAIIFGISEGVDYWEHIVFNHKLPRWACWIVAILSIPINLILMLIITIKGRSVSEEGWELICEVEDHKESCEEI